MKLFHYSAKPFILDTERVYVQPSRHAPAFKPSGLWLSVGDSTDGWRDWCEGERFRLHNLKYCTEVRLLASANILRLVGSEALDDFTARYSFRITRFFEMIDWARVATEYEGICIAPYVWERRLSLHWYYPWDCASACIWAVRKLRVDGR